MTDNLEMNGHRLPERMAAAESDIKALTKDIREISEGVKELTVLIRDSDRHWSLRHQTKWGPLWSGMAVLLVIIGMVGTLVASGLNKDQGRLEKLQETQLMALQREMTLRELPMTARLNRKQDDIELLQEWKLTAVAELGRIDERIKSLDNHIHELRKEQQARTGRVYGGAGQ